MKLRDRVTEEYIRSRISKITYNVVPDSTVTICNITMKNGFNVIGKSACINPVNFDINIGQDIALKDAFNKIWELEGYLLTEERYNEYLNRSEVKD